MPEYIITGKFRGVMADYEIEQLRIWDELGDKMIEPPSRSGEMVAKWP
jgi:hypothetical protein